MLLSTLVLYIYGVWDAKLVQTETKSYLFSHQREDESLQLVQAVIDACAPPLLYQRLQSLPQFERFFPGGHSAGCVGSHIERWSVKIV